MKYDEEKVAREQPLKGIAAEVVDVEEVFSQNQLLTVERG